LNHLWLFNYKPCLPRGYAGVTVESISPAIYHLW